ncbi:hypothetical protein KUTeg_014902 [Tegillarca granosa]|uniref:Uncharacterized protein n=1 Tax=Tegillarca granosa TaxID=220873 RepID=A0ABQ9ENK8_TEGGR|nr:hypothetical protein KUTeg_014902 [Tegillarca granosa]
MTDLSCLFRAQITQPIKSPVKGPETQKLDIKDQKNVNGEDIVTPSNDQGNRRSRSPSRSMSRSPSSDVSLGKRNNDEHDRKWGIGEKSDMRRMSTDSDTERRMYEKVHRSNERSLSKDKLPGSKIQYDLAETEDPIRASPVRAPVYDESKKEGQDHPVLQGHMIQEVQGQGLAQEIQVVQILVQRKTGKNLLKKWRMYYCIIKEKIKWQPPPEPEEPDRDHSPPPAIAPVVSMDENSQDTRSSLRIPTPPLPSIGEVKNKRSWSRTSSKSPTADTQPKKKSLPRSPQRSRSRSRSHGKKKGLQEDQYHHLDKDRQFEEGHLFLHEENPLLEDAPLCHLEEDHPYPGEDHPRQGKDPNHRDVIHHYHQGDVQGHRDQEELPLHQEEGQGLPERDPHHQGDINDHHQGEFPDVQGRDQGVDQDVDPRGIEGVCQGIEEDIVVVGQLLQGVGQDQGEEVEVEVSEEEAVVHEAEVVVLEDVVDAATAEAKVEVDHQVVRLLNDWKINVKVILQFLVKFSLNSGNYLVYLCKLFAIYMN